MQKLILIFLAGMCSCSEIIRPLNPKGEIVEITKSDTTYIKVKFLGAINPSIIFYEWYLGSDTCRVGQIVNLK
jgi:hypothetical protein